MVFILVAGTMLKTLYTGAWVLKIFLETTRKSHVNKIFKAAVYKKYKGNSVKCLLVSE